MAYDQATLTSPQLSTSSEALLAPGFRFHPTDEELVSYYLKRKICGKKFRFDAISEVDVYKVEPWDLPGKSKLKSKDSEWYFFSGLDKKYGNGARTNRATEKGYWKTTGKDREVYHKSQVVGMKKTLVYHEGRAPRGQRTNWVMHEYKLMDLGLAKAGISQDAFVLCRIFQKSGPGPMNGAKYGAPLVEEEWETDELALAPAKEVVEEALVGDDNDIYLDSSDLEQIFDGKIPTEDVPLLLNFSCGDAGSQVQEIPAETSDYAPKQEHNNQHFSVSQMQNQVCMEPPNEQFVGESDNSVNDMDFLLDEPFFDAEATGLFDDVAFLEPDDFLNSINGDPSGVDMLEEYLNFFSEDQGKNSQYMVFDSSNMVENENLFVDQKIFNSELVDGQVEQEIGGNQQLVQGLNDNNAFTSAQNRQNVKSGGQFSYIQKASNILGGISAPPALASEFPTKESTIRLVTGSTSSVHLTAGMIQIQKPKLNGIQTSFVLSLGLSHKKADNALSFEPSVTGVLTNAMSAVARSFMYLMVLWVTYRVGSFFCSGNVSS